VEVTRQNQSRAHQHERLPERDNEQGSIAQNSSQDLFTDPARGVKAHRPKYTAHQNSNEVFGQQPFLPRRLMAGYFFTFAPHMRGAFSARLA
jgi:hypothetical protein